MANWNLKSFDDIYSSIAESAYKDRPNSFPKLFNKNKSTEIDYSKRKRITKVKSLKAEVRICQMVARFIFNRTVKSY